MWSIWGAGCRFGVVDEMGRTGILRWGALFSKHLSIVCLPLGMVMIFDYIKQAPFQATLNGMERIGLSSLVFRVDTDEMCGCQGGVYVLA